MAGKQDMKRKKGLLSSSSEGEESGEETISRLLDVKLTKMRKDLQADMLKIIEEKLVPMWSIVNEIGKKVDDAKTEAGEIKEKAESLEKRVAELEGEKEHLTDLEKRVAELEGEKEQMTNMEKRVAELEGEKVHLTNMAQDSLRKANDMEQYSRKYSFRVLGAERQENQSCSSAVHEILKTRLGLSEMKLADIAIAHPLPKYQGAAASDPAPIYFRLANPELREPIIKNRKKLKRTGITVKDDMTRLNATLLNRTKNHEGVESAWFHNGKVLFKPNGSNRPLQIMPYQDLNGVIRRTSQAPVRTPNTRDAGGANA